MCAPVDADIASRAGKRAHRSDPEDLRTTAPPVALLQRALSDGDHGLGILIWADAVITATSPESHEEIETTLASLCRDHSVSVLCVYDRDSEPDGAGTGHLDLRLPLAATCSKVRPPGWRLRKYYLRQGDHAYTGVGGCVFGDHCLPQSFLGGS